MGLALDLRQTAVPADGGMKASAGCVCYRRRRPVVAAIRNLLESVPLNVKPSIAAGVPQQRRSGFTFLPGPGYIRLPDSSGLDFGAALIRGLLIPSSSYQPRDVAMSVRAMAGSF
jgi:hypothetical protein